MINNISPIDGRYKQKTKELENYFSEYALIKCRVKIEIEYLIKLLQTIDMKDIFLDEKTTSILRNIYLNFGTKDAEKIKEIEKKTNHDVKAVEYFIKQKLSLTPLKNYSEFVHFALTSQDINNTSLPFLVKSALNNVLLPSLNDVIICLKAKAKEYQHIPMLSRTHGQPATPTGLGKEFKVFIERLENQIELLKNTRIKGKFGGASGNFNAHVVAFPNIDWIEFADDFVRDLGLERSKFTTQIAHYDSLAEVFHCLSRINNILIDLCRDVWAYISMNYFNQKVLADEVGSSAMPHKVNPIDFENAEGNLGMANSILIFLAQKLPVSRLQRDLTDSTVARNVGVPFGHMLIALKSIQKGLNKLELNENQIAKDLEDNWAVISEAIQNVLRRENYSQPYEVLKSFSRGKPKLSKDDFISFIDSLEISDNIKKELKSITPQNYVGYSLS